MPNYRRNRVPGGSYFFTVNLRDRDSSSLIDHIDRLRDCIRACRKSTPFHIDAWVVLPNHMHCIWTLPEGDDAYPSRWLRIKKEFSRASPMGEERSLAMAARGDRGVWQRGYWEHTIRNDHDYSRHMDYVHFNPVKHGLVNHPAHWPYSTFHRAVASGLYPETWLPDDDANEDLNFGER